MKLTYWVSIVALATGCSASGSDTECTETNHCVVDAEGSAECEAGYDWVDAESSSDFRCEESGSLDPLSDDAPRCGDGHCNGDENASTCVMDCPGEEGCTPGTDQCTCTSTGACRSGLMCDHGNVCIPEPAPCTPGTAACECREGGSCLPGLLCDDTNVCVAPAGCEAGTEGCECAADNTCGDGLECGDLGICGIPPGCTKGTEGCGCTDEHACDTDLECSASNTCIVPTPCPAGTQDCPCGVDDVCDTDLECSGSGVCVPETVCVPGTEACECDVGSTCGLGLTCDGDTCVLTDPPVGLPVLGGGDHTLSGVSTTVIASFTDGLNDPRDLEFHPHYPTELWIVNHGDNSIVVVFNTGTETQSSGKAAGPGSVHFLAKPSGIAFGANGNAATSQDEDQSTQPSTPADFMGPTLWSTDLNIFDGGHAGHLDMLHNSPNGAGIAWEVGNAYWIFDGAHNSLTRYDFKQDHGPGGADHSDGVVARYVEGEVSYVDDASAHIVLDHGTNLLYVADAGNNRIAALDITTGTAGGDVGPNYDGTDQYEVTGATLTTVVDGSTVTDMSQPGGLELHDGKLFMSDSATGSIFAFTLAGELIDYLDTGLAAGALNGLAFDGNGDLYFADAAANEIVRVQPLP